ncbi:MAG: phosphoglycerate dehydrogenase, partial [Chloroflexi bacterium]|nr:phosphoglycerate dehydrogenase [Chloroflexota bacterium]
MPRVLVSDPIDNAGVELLRAEAEVDTKFGIKQPELLSIIGDYDALIVRSETKVNREVLEAGRSLQVVGRAGVGVDNIDVEAATSKGIAVVFSPTGNIIAAAEHTIALLLSLNRNIPQANVSLKQGQWRRSAFTGVEVRGKTLGIVGLGRVGSEVARRAQGFQVRLLGYDPFMS